MGIRDLKPHYRSGKDDLQRDFFIPCLAECVRYRRAAGYFKGSALMSWAAALTTPIQIERFTAQLLISPEVRGDDLAALASADDAETLSRLRQKASDQVLLDLLALLESKDLDDTRRLQGEILAWLVANDRLEIRFAFPEHVEGPGLFHEKIGIFEFPENLTVAFIGSANESIHGHSKNYESLDVYRSWVLADADRIVVKVDQFQQAWDGDASGLNVERLSPGTLARIREYVASRGIDPTRSPYFGTAPASPNKWAHQDAAVQRFLAARRGVLEMATGTGKTRTAIKAMTVLIAQGQIDSVIVATEGVDLLDQWTRELDDWALELDQSVRVLRHYGKHHEMAGFSNNPKMAVICISRSQLAHLIASMDAGAKRRTLIVHDEVHGLGSPAMRAELAGTHGAFPYCLGLSATPEREYDSEGTDFITTEIGPVIFTFDLRDAIALGILCEFDYVPLPYDLTEGDKQRLQQVYAREAASRAGGTPMSDKDVWIELARVYKTAEQKPGAFAVYLAGRKDILESCVVFVDDRAYGDKVLAVIAGYTYRYRTYYAEDDRENLMRFAAREIDCLITCHRISQGIDIRGLRAVVLVSSARSRLETIQRIGRCLRTDPKTPYKRALVVDFVRPLADGDTDNSDTEREAWLEDLARVRTRI
jgi:superfamily II DNA or RNA helicase